MKWKFFVPTWVFPIIIVLSVGTVWLRLNIVDTTYRINQTDIQIRRLTLDQQKLSLKLAEVRSPRRLEGLAKSKFGLRPTEASQIISLK